MTTLTKRVDDQAQLSHESIREAEESFYTHLKRVGLKHTGQRDAILRTFLETHEHLSTEELHHLVQRSDPRIGFTTVYRTLKLLADCGLASEVEFHDGVTRYEHQYNRRSHHHMVCTECGSFGRVLLPGDRKNRTRDRPQTPLPDHPPHLPGLRHLRPVPEEEARKTAVVGGPKRTSQQAPG